MKKVPQLMLSPILTAGMTALSCSSMAYYGHSTVEKVWQEIHQEQQERPWPYVPLFERGYYMFASTSTAAARQIVFSLYPASLDAPALHLIDKEPLGSLDLITTCTSFESLGPCAECSCFAGTVDQTAQKWYHLFLAAIQRRLVHTDYFTNEELNKLDSFYRSNTKIKKKKK